MLFQLFSRIIFDLNFERKDFKIEIRLVGLEKIEIWVRTSGGYAMLTEKLTEIKEG